MSKAGWGGKREAGEGKKPARRPTSNEKLALEPKAEGKSSIAGFFTGPPQGGASSSHGASAGASAGASTAVGSVRAREPGSTPKKEQATKQKLSPRMEAVPPRAAQERAWWAGEDDDVQLVSERTREERDAEGHANAIPIDDGESDDLQAESTPPLRDERLPKVEPKVEPSSPQQPPPPAPPPVPPPPAATVGGSPREPLDSATMASLASLVGNITLTLEHGTTMLAERIGLSTRSSTQSISQTLQSEVNSLRSELRGEFAAIRREEQKAARAILEEVQGQRKALQDERKQFAESKKLASERKWLAMLGNGRYICIHCDHHFHQLSEQGCGRFLESPWLQRNGGVKYNYNFNSQIRDHESSKMHSICISLEEERDAQPLLHAFRLAEHDADEVTARVFKIVLDSLKHYRSFLEHEALCFLQVQLHPPYGTRPMHAPCSHPMERVHAEPE